MNIFIVMENNGQPYEDNHTSFHKAYKSLEDAQKDIDDLNTKVYTKPTHEDYIASGNGDWMSYEEYCEDDEQKWDYYIQPVTRSIVITELH